MLDTGVVMHRFTLITARAVVPTRRSAPDMTTRHRRPSAYQPRPATLPPGTHFRGAPVVSPADEGPEDEGLMLTDEVPLWPSVEQPGGTPDQFAVVAEPYDAERPPPQLDGGPSRRTRLSVLVLVAVVVVATSAAYLGWRLVGEDGREAASAQTPTSTPPATLSPTSPPSPSTTVPLSGDVPPVEPPDGGSYLEVTVLDSGDLDVDQWVRSSTPLTALELSVPADPLVGDRVVASDLRVSTDGTEADVPGTLGSSPTVLSLTDVHRVHLTYRLSGAVLRSPSRSDRALARTVSLDLDLNGQPRREPSTISFRGATALTVICDGGSAGGAQERCGRRDDTGDWQVRAAARGTNERVVALLELPAPTAG